MLYFCLWADSDRPACHWLLYTHANHQSVIKVQRNLNTELFLCFKYIRMLSISSMLEFLLLLMQKYQPLTNTKHHHLQYINKGVLFVLCSPGDYLKTCFLRDVRRYTCAFLNSEGGSLLVGVDNDGTICGVVISHIWEDHARQQVDSCLKMFKPPVFPHQYSLIFLPVVRPGQDGRRLRVVCLTLQSPVANTEPILYQTDIEDIYIRRDGSVEGPLSVTTAMEWLSQVGQSLHHYFTTSCTC
uniref:Schlafen AlbA-2 domain-containing protein n=1 Tax=Myripristis murdjan TaxID=586833 RepID=A0A667ZU39_9TELE